MAEDLTPPPSPPPVGDAPPVIEIRGLGTRFGAQVVHEDLELTVRRGEIVGLVGGSGSGKTTLLREVALLDAPSAGSVRLFGAETVGLDESEAFALRRRFGMMFQHGALFSSLTVRENVAVPLHEHTTLPEAEIDRLAELKVVLAGLPPGSGDKYPSQLSGGMIKRAGVARALALDPDLLFLDEPTAGLDPVGAAALDELVLELRAALGLTVLIVTHDLDTLWRITDRVAFLGERRVLACEPIESLSRRPHPLIRQYFCGPRARAAEAAAED
ncbi:MAG TPA: ATP-binding cassette domain-containing protein [Plasticicumulans sp.]|nr:ATP-binding cassette domain-containing protein [Plasticicumulans sp.]